jgi:hypothetical protein
MRYGQFGRHAAAIALAVMACSLSAFDYGIAKVSPEEQTDRAALHRSILRGEAPSPYRYRVLAPLVIESLAAAARPVWGADASFRRAFTLVAFASLVALLLSQYAYLKVWFTDEQALVGMLALACVLRATLEDNTLRYAPWSLLEPSLLTLALLAIWHRRTIPLLPLTLIASLNRETGILIPLALAINGFKERSPRQLRMAAVCFAISIAVFVGLRFTLHAAPPVYSLATIWEMNRSGEGIRAAAQNVLLFMGVSGWILVAFGWRRAPQYVKRTYWLIPAYLPLYLIWGVWYEVRLLMPIYPILLPALLASLYPPTGRRT